MAHGNGWLSCASLVAAWLFGCGGNNGYQYTRAAIGLGATLGTTAVYRATTGGCWANCTLGFACDRESGLCRRRECIPACATSQTCVIEAGDRFRCVDVLGAGPLTSNTLGRPSSSAPATSSAPSLGAAPATSSAPPTSSASPN